MHLFIPLFFSENPLSRPSFTEILTSLTEICADVCPELENVLAERKREEEEREKRREKEREEEVAGYEVELVVDWENSQVFYFCFCFYFECFLTE